MDGRYDIHKGVPIKKRIHKQFHKQYGNGNNTIEQFENYLKENYEI